MKTNIKIIGVHSHSEGYPNVKYSIEALKKSDQLQVSEYCVPLWKTRYAGHNGLFAVFYTLLKALRAHLKVYFHLLFNNECKTLYVPYPGIFVVYLTQFLPRSKKPDKILLDAFISIYDTVVYDRKLLKERALLSRVLKHIESTAFNLSTYTLSDTPQNSAYYAELFKLSSSKFVDIPLSTNENDFQSGDETHTTNNTIRVLFFGTLVPLHGIDIIMQAARLLSSDANIYVRIVGNGQDSEIVANELKSSENISWFKDWQSSKELNKEIQVADICLGVFGNTDKTDRVCPYKLYSYAQCGKAIITAATTCINELNSREYQPWLYTVPPNDPVALANAIRTLADKKNKRIEYANRSRRFYEKNLSNVTANKQLFDLIT